MRAGHRGVPLRSRDRSGRSLIKGSEFTKGYEMTGDASTGARLLGTLGTADGKGVVRVKDRFDADIETVQVSGHRPDLRCRGRPVNRSGAAIGSRTGRE